MISLLDSSSWQLLDTTPCWNVMGVQQHYIMPLTLNVQLQVRWFELIRFELDAEGRKDGRTSRHCFIFYSVRAGGSCCNSLSNVHPEKQNQYIHLPAKCYWNILECSFLRKIVHTLFFIGRQIRLLIYRFMVYATALLQH